MRTLILLAAALTQAPVWAQTTLTVSITGPVTAASTGTCRTLTIPVRVTNASSQLVTGLARTAFTLFEGSTSVGNPASVSSTQTGYALVYTTTQASSFSLSVRVDTVAAGTPVVLSGSSAAQTVTLNCFDPATAYIVVFDTVPTASATDCRTFSFNVRVTFDGGVRGLTAANFFIIESTATTGGVSPASVQVVDLAGGVYRLTYTTTQLASFPLRVRVSQTFSGDPPTTYGGISPVVNVTLACENPSVTIDSVSRNCAQNQITVKFTVRGIVLANRDQLTTDFIFTFTEGTTDVAFNDIIDFVADSTTTTSASLTLTYRTRIINVPRFTFRVRVQRRNGLGAEASQELDACIVPPPVAGCGTATAALTLNQPFSFQAAVISGGQAPFNWSYVPQLTDVTAFQNNLVVVQAGGAVSATPTRAGPARITLRVTDAFNRTSDVGCLFNVTSGTPLTLTCGELATARGTTDTPYSARASATGGTPPYRWAITDASNTFAIDGNGTVTGRPAAARNFPVTLRVTDSLTPTPATQTTDCTITVQAAAPPPPVALCGGITATGTAAVAGQAFSATAAVQNGTGQAPFTWTLITAPEWLSLQDAAAGRIGGTPPIDSQAATVNVSLRVQDNLRRDSAPVACSFRLTQPPVSVTPSLTLAAGATPAANGTATVRLSGPAPAELRGRLELTFAPDVASAIAATDTANPSFVDGAPPDRRTLAFTVAAGGATVAAPVQIGTVAGVITVRLTQLVRVDTNQDFLPAAAVVQTITVPRSRPSISAGSVSLETTPPAGCSTVAGAAAYVFVRSAFSTSREITGGKVTFTVATGRTVDGATEFTLDANTEFRQAFTNWFNSAPGKQNGGAFGFCLPVTLANGAVADITNVTVQLKNGATPGDSDAVSWK